MYYIFGVLFVVFGILVVTCAEITIVLCYFQLCSEDYRWWWRAFFTSGSSALYMFLYSAFYFVTKLEITKLVSTLMYFGTPGARCASVCAHKTDASTTRLHADPERLILPHDRCADAGGRTACSTLTLASLRRHCGLPGLLAVRARDLWQRQDRLNERGRGALGLARRVGLANNQKQSTPRRCCCRSAARKRAHAARHSVSQARVSPSAPVPPHGGARGAPGAHQRLLRRAHAGVRHRLRLL